MKKLILVCLGQMCFVGSSAQNFTSSNLPIISIETAGGAAIPDEPKLLASMKIRWKADTSRNFLTDTVFHFNGNIGIELRGQSSQEVAQKKSYGITSYTTASTSSAELNIPLFNFPQEHDWILYASAFDEAFINNPLMYQLSNIVGRYASRMKFVELFINGSYQGLYLFGEKAKRDANRVNISKLKTTDIAGDDLTGGYIVKLDSDDGGYRWGSVWGSICNPGHIAVFEISYPTPSNVQPQQKAYIQQYITDFESKLHNKDFHPTTGYQQFADLDSFVDYMLLNEISKGNDSYRRSTYFHKDKNSKGGKIKMGPIWDYDSSMGRSTDCNGNNPQGWCFEKNMACFGPGSSPMSFWWEYLMQDTTFVQKAQRRWLALRQNKFSTATVLARIDSMALVISESFQRNASRWGITYTLTSQINTRKTWLTNRLTWIDNNIQSLGYYIKPYNATQVCNFNGLMLSGMNTANVSHLWRDGLNNSLSTAISFSPSSPGAYQYVYSFSHNNSPAPAIQCTYTHQKTLTLNSTNSNTSVQTGPWESPNTWACGVAPNSLQKAIIGTNNVVTLSSATATRGLGFLNNSQLSLALGGLLQLQP